MSPRRAELESDRFSADQLQLQVAGSWDPAVFDLASYDDFIDYAVGGRDYQVEAIRTVLRFFCAQQYKDATDLAEKSYHGSVDLQRRYTSAQALIDRLPLPNMLSCSLDLATGTGKSYVMYAIARIMLNEGLVDRVLLLCPSTTIEDGLTEKFNQMTADADLGDLLPERPNGHRLPTVVSGNTTIKIGDICVENVHQAYENAGSSLRDSLVGQGQRTLVLSDEAHHVLSAGAQTTKKWLDFLADPEFDFRFHLGLSGTCYVGNEYFPDVVYRYAVREAIDEGWVKEVFYLQEDDSTTDDERFQKLLAQHEKNRRTYKPIKPLTIAVTRDIPAANALAEELITFLAARPGSNRQKAEARVLVVTSSPKHAANVRRLKTVDDPADTTEWIVSVSMLSEGWDVKNVFQIYPHQKRAFDSKLLISQVLGRGLRRPPGCPKPVVYVFNHQRWGDEIDKFVAEILDTESGISQVPVHRPSAPHFDVHQLVTSPLPQKVKVTPLTTNKKLDGLKLVPQLDADEETKFVSATDVTRAVILTTRVVEKRYPFEAVIADVRQKLLDHDARTKGTLAQEYPKARVEKMVRTALEGIGADGTEVSQENRQRILNSFGGLRQRTAKSTAKLTTVPVDLSVVSTSQMRPVFSRLAGLTKDTGLFYDETSAGLCDPGNAAALVKAEDLQDPKNLYDVPNPFDFKSPTNVVLTDHQPERRFVRALTQPKNSAAIRSWVKAPDTGFYEIEYSYQEGGGGRSKRGLFNPDFFIWLAAVDVVVVCEVKGDGDDSWRNQGKWLAGQAHFHAVNEMLKKRQSARRYVFRFISPRDYDKFFEALRATDLEPFRSSLEGLLSTKA